MALISPVTLIIPKFRMPKRQVSSFRMTFTQQTDNSGQVTALPIGGKITMTLKTLNLGITDMVHWAADKEKTESGTITFQNTTTGIVMKIISFKDAYCVSYTEKWDDTISNTSLAHTEEITISCREIKIDNQELFKNNWDLIIEE